MQRLIYFGNMMLRQQDLALIVLMVMIIFMMIIPLPTPLVDTLIALNISMAVLILLVTLSLQQPLEFSSFPAILLITTLFRLSLSISTTRLILLEGDAGQIIETFGEIIISGNIVVGLVIFLIITIVQFLVVTKGADRVAEVSARFTLDAMPGKQMGIDADLRAGNIDQNQASARRSNLETESKLFGAMDGAMKFVKGDAIAGLVITVVNLIGGIVIGQVQLGMSFGEALQEYSILTIGDGLVAQIPALLIAISSGAMVTRVAGKDNANLATDLSVQILGNTRVLQISGIILIFFAFIPGFPKIQFFSLAGLLLLTAYFRGRKIKKEKAQEATRDNVWGQYIDYQKQLADKTYRKNNEPPKIKVLLAKSVEKESCYAFATQFEDVRKKIMTDMGVGLGFWTVDFHNLPTNDFIIQLDGASIYKGTYFPNCVYVRLPKVHLDLLDIEPVHVEGENAWIPQKYSEKLVSQGVEVVDPASLIIMNVEECVMEHLPNFITVHKVSQHLLSIQSSHPSLVEEVKAASSVPKITDVLRRLVEEGISITNINGILESIVEWAPKEANPILLVEYVRAALSYQIGSEYTVNGFMNVILIAPSVENKLRDALRTTPTGSYLLLAPEDASSILEQVRQLVHQPHRKGDDPVLLTQLDIRRHFRNLLQHRGLYVPVLSFQEVPTSITIYPVGFVS